MKVTLTKQPGNAETITVETSWDGTPEGWLANIQPLLDQLDIRMHQQNMRMLKGAYRARQISPEAAHAASEILSMVNGVSLSEAVEKLEQAGIPV